ncbi:hypothetical protein [Paenibacillus borealis]|uniref:RCK N-terminal domain-containing protein n=1 Tax=Paenibacillus borealis TaxID=160799 RepID=A0A089MUK6_PAEBO|nr:hypothetical protein [Paenibacillus borealis]AIQ60139.1 hypothetical protein PBOR_26715 [Paenibacillus borealis]
MLDKDEYVLVCAPTLAGEHFIELLTEKGIKVAGLTNNPDKRKRLENLGVEQNIVVDSHDERTWGIPPFSIGKVYLFESNLAVCCRYLQMCRPWTSKSIFVITTSVHPRLVYKGLGANYVIYSHSGNVHFLADQ